jgi:hypothetical protein
MGWGHTDIQSITLEINESASFFKVKPTENVEFWDFCSSHIVLICISLAMSAVEEPFEFLFL